jgi:hypothetical protein
VKSAATQTVLEDYIARFTASPLDRMFFICHSPVGTLAAKDRRDVHVWTGAPLSERAVDAGLFGWLHEVMRSRQALYRETHDRRGERRVIPPPRPERSWPLAFHRVARSGDSSLRASSRRSSPAAVARR